MKHAYSIYNTAYREKFGALRELHPLLVLRFITDLKKG
jgi:hypothetical protein